MNAQMERMMFWDLFPMNASAEGPMMDGMIEAMHWFMFILAVFWGVFFIVALFKFRAGANPKADYEGLHATFPKYLEVLVVLVEIVFLAGFSIPLWAKYSSEFPDEKKSTVVRVVAEQFAWNFHYAGPDGKFGKSDINKIDVQSNPLGLDRTGDPNAADDVVSPVFRMPVDKPVIAHITSKDVIHAVGIPALRVKQDAIPGLTIPVYFTPIKTGKYLIACSQLCGSGHAKMRGFVEVHSQSEFDQWLDKQAQEAKAEAAEGESW